MVHRLLSIFSKDIAKLLVDVYLNHDTKLLLLIAAIQPLPNPNIVELYTRVGQLDSLKNVYSTNPELITSSVCSAAARHGHLEILQWCRSNNIPWNKWICAIAAQNGHLHIIQWACANGDYLNEHICTYAALNNRLDILQWARANNCPWDENTCVAAIQNRHLDVFKWAYTNGAPLCQTAEILLLKGAMPPLEP